MCTSNSLVCAYVRADAQVRVSSCVCVYVWERATECEYWLGGIVLSRGHLSPAGPLALQLFRMCHRSVSQTGRTHTHTNTHMCTQTRSNGNEWMGQISFDIRGQKGTQQPYICYTLRYNMWNVHQLAWERTARSKVMLHTKITRPVNTAEERLAGCDIAHKFGMDRHYGAYGGTPAAGRRRWSYDPCKTQPC